MAIARNVDGNEVRLLRTQGWSLNKIAEHLGVSQGAVRHHSQGIVVKAPTQKREYRCATMSDGKPLPPSADLAYLTGIICGDGSISSMPRTYALTIACDARYPELIDTYRELVEKLLQRKPSIYAGKENTYFGIRLYDKYLPTILGLPAGAKQQDYPVPEWIFSELDYVRPFIRGLIETDGNIYHEYRNGGWCSRCLFCAKNESIMQAFLRGTKLLGYEFRRIKHDARFTRTALVKQLALELDLKKNRVYIQKPKSINLPKSLDME
ncbi:hypothetical protein EON83_04740 [bacterium]|nr:MAG: hypothetical protein EON83_04740 [bacterium]